MAILLIIDDDPDILLLLETRYSARGHKVTVAATCAEGLGVAACHTPDLILLDFRLPQIDGARFIEILRADELTKKTPVIVMSAASPTWVASRLASDPLVRVIEKPFDFVNLDKLIEEVVGARPT